MYKDFKIKAPFFEIGPKAFLYGEEMLKLAKVADEVAKKYDVDIILTPQYTDIKLIADIWMATPSDVLELAALYVRIYFLGAIPSALYNFGAAIMRANGDTRRPMTYLTVAGILNVLLNLVFVTIIKLDVAGVALATVASQTLSAVLVLHALALQHDATHLDFSCLRIYGAEMKKILKIGIPAGLQGMTFSVSNMLIQGSVNSFGTAAISGVAASTSLTGFTYTAMNSFRHATLNFVGQNCGAKKFDRVRRVAWNSILCVTVIGIALGLLSAVFAEPLLNLYITDSAEAIQYGITRMWWFGLTYFLAGIMEIFMGALQGLGKSTASMFINVFCTCFIRIVWILTIFAAAPSLNSLYISYPVSWGLAIIVETVVFSRIVKRKEQEES